MNKPMAYTSETRHKQEGPEQFVARLLGALGPDEAKQFCRENHWYGTLSLITKSR